METPTDLQKHYRAKDLAERLGVHKNTIWRWVRNGRLPKPIRMGSGTSFWSAEMVQEAISRVMQGGKS